MSETKLTFLRQALFLSKRKEQKMVNLVEIPFVIDFAGLSIFCETPCKSQSSYKIRMREEHVQL